MQLDQGVDSRCGLPAGVKFLKTSLSMSEPEKLADRRAANRLPVALPVILDLGGQRIGARLIDLTLNGGRIEASAVPLPNSKLVLHCGTVVIAGTVVWSRGSQIGMKFRVPLSERQFDEQVRRAIALASRLGSESRCRAFCASTVAADRRRVRVAR